MTIYERELQWLKPDDEVQFTEDINGFGFISTAGHGYLVVPVDHSEFTFAKGLTVSGFIGRYATYLEEDFEAVEFLRAVS